MGLVPRLPRTLRSRGMASPQITLQPKKMTHALVDVFLAGSLEVRGNSAKQFGGGAHFHASSSLDQTGLKPSPTDTSRFRHFWNRRTPHAFLSTPLLLPRPGKGVPLTPTLAKRPNLWVSHVGFSLPATRIRGAGQLEFKVLVRYIRHIKTIDLDFS